MLKYAKLIAVAIAMAAGNILAAGGYVNDGFYYSDDLLIGFETQQTVASGTNVFIENYDDRPVTLRLGFGRLSNGLKTTEASLAIRFHTKRTQYIHLGWVTTKGDYKDPGCETCTASPLDAKGLKVSYGSEHNLAENLILRIGFTWTLQDDLGWKGDIPQTDESGKDNLDSYYAENFNEGFEESGTGLNVGLIYRF